MALYVPHSRGSPFPLKTGTSKPFSCLHESSPILLHRSVNDSNPSPSAAANISDITPDGPAALPFLVFFNAFSTSVLVILQLGPRSSHKRHHYPRYSPHLALLHIVFPCFFLMPMLSITILPVE